MLKIALSEVVANMTVIGMRAGIYRGGTFDGMMKMTENIETAVGIFDELYSYYKRPHEEEGGASAQPKCSRGTLVQEEDESGNDGSPHRTSREIIKSSP